MPPTKEEQAAVDAAHAVLKKHGKEWQDISDRVMCTDTVAYFAWTGGVTGKQIGPDEARLNLVKEDSSPVLGSNGIFHLDPGEVIGFFDSQRPAGHRLVHLMLCTGGGKAVGNNNSSVLGANYRLFMEVDLSNLPQLKWEDEGKVTAYPDGVGGKGRSLIVRHRALHSYGRG